MYLPTTIQPIPLKSSSLFVRHKSSECKKITLILNAKFILYTTTTIEGRTIWTRLWCEWLLGILGTKTCRVGIFLKSFFFLHLFFTILMIIITTFIFYSRCLGSFKYTVNTLTNKSSYIFSRYFFSWGFLFKYKKSYETSSSSFLSSNSCTIFVTSHRYYKDATKFVQLVGIFFLQ